MFTGRVPRFAVLECQTTIQLLPLCRCWRVCLHVNQAVKHILLRDSAAKLHIDNLHRPEAIPGAADFVVRLGPRTASCKLCKNQSNQRHVHNPLAGLRSLRIARWAKSPSKPPSITTGRDGTGDRPRFRKLKLQLWSWRTDVRVHLCNCTPNEKKRNHTATTQHARCPCPLLQLFHPTETTRGSDASAPHAATGDTNLQYASSFHECLYPSKTTTSLAVRCHASRFLKG